MTLFHSCYMMATLPGRLVCLGFFFWFVCQHELWEIYEASLTKLGGTEPICFGIHWKSVADT